jgi:PhnB protein
MSDRVTPIPEGFHTITPFLVVRGADQAIEFYKKAFNAQALEVDYTPDGKVMHATVKIGDSLFMLADEFPEFGSLSPQSGGISGTGLHLYLENVDPVFEQAVSAGATVKMPLMDAFWGDRYGQIVDPFGHKWSLGTRTRILSKAEIEEGARQAFAQMPQKQVPQKKTA